MPGRAEAADEVAVLRQRRYVVAEHMLQRRDGGAGRHAAAERIEPRGFALSRLRENALEARQDREIAGPQQESSELVADVIGQDEGRVGDDAGALDVADRADQI